MTIPNKHPPSSNVTCVLHIALGKAVVTVNIQLHPRNAIRIVDIVKWPNLKNTNTLFVCTVRGQVHTKLWKQMHKIILWFGVIRWYRILEVFKAMDRIWLVLAFPSVLQSCSAGSTTEGSATFFSKCPWILRKEENAEKQYSYHVRLFGIRDRWMSFVVIHFLFFFLPPNLIY